MKKSVDMMLTDIESKVMGIFDASELTYGEIATKLGADSIGPVVTKIKTSGIERMWIETLCKLVDACGMRVELRFVNAKGEEVKVKGKKAGRREAASERVHPTVIKKTANPRVKKVEDE